MPIDLLFKMKNSNESVRSGRQESVMEQPMRREDTAIRTSSTLAPVK